MDYKKKWGKYVINWCHLGNFCVKLFLPCFTTNNQLATIFLWCDLFWRHHADIACILSWVSFKLVSRFSNSTVSNSVTRTLLLFFIFWLLIFNCVCSNLKKHKSKSLHHLFVTHCHTTKLHILHCLDNFDTRNIFSEIYLHLHCDFCRVDFF